MSFTCVNRRGYFAIALLAASWLPGIGYFHLPDALAWSVLVGAALLLLFPGSQEGERNGDAASFAIAQKRVGSRFPDTTRDVFSPDRVPMVAAAALCAIASFCLPWPYRAIALLLACGAALQALPMPVRWPRALGSACVSAGMVMLAQSIVLFAYTQFTARSHELPEVLADAITGIAHRIGIDAAYDGQNISLPTMRVNHPLGATWELLIDPATLCFLVGGLIWIGRRNWRGELAFIGCVLLWIPARIALLLGLFMHRALRTDYEAPIMLMDQFWSTTVNLIMLIGPALLAFCVVPTGRPSTAAQSAAPGRFRPLGAATLALTGAFILALALYYDPIGQRQQGRVLFDEYHRIDMPDSGVHGWEPTDTTFNTEDYGHNASYTYCILYDYLTHFYNVSRLTTKLDDQTLAGCDVYVLKVPTAKLEPTEVTALTRFVAHGGGVMLIGEHTDVFGTGTYLNDVARKFGFRFRYDCLFDIDQLFQERYRPDVVPHPIVQNLPELDWAVSCSIEPMPVQFGDLEFPLQFNSGRAAMVATGLRNLPGDYHASNFYPQVEHVDRAEERYGSFVQMWTQRHLLGRVIGFTDSTQFSNFCLFDPGKSELFLGMTEWLNHRATHDDPRLPLAGIGAIALLAAWSLSRGRRSMTLLAVSASICGWSIAVPAIGAFQKRAMPLPKPDATLKRVVMDRTVCDSTLPLAGFIAGKPDGYGIFERWILRLGYFTTRRSGDDALHDNLLVFTNPDKPVSNEFRDSVERYVNDGGKILVIDSAENQASTANSLLSPFNVQFKRDAALSGDLELASTVSATQPATQPATTSSSPIPVTNAVEVAPDKGTDGDVLAKITDKPVSILLHHGKGTVTLVGYGTRFSDLNMGFTGDNPPDPAMRAVYQVEFDLLRKIVDGK